MHHYNQTAHAFTTNTTPMTMHPMHVVRLSLCGSAVIIEKNARNRLMMVNTILAMVMVGVDSFLRARIGVVKIQQHCYMHYITDVTVVAMGFVVG